MTLYVVQASGSEDEALARARFVADRFSWGAFAFSVFWLAFRGLWLVLILWLAAAATFIIFVSPHVSLWATLAVDGIARLFLGLEAHRLRLGKGERRVALTELVEARDRDEAEAIFFARLRPPAP